MPWKKGGGGGIKSYNITILLFHHFLVGLFSNLKNVIKGPAKKLYDAKKNKLLQISNRNLTLWKVHMH